MSNYNYMLIPKYNTNDDSVQVTKWLVSDKNYVKKGEIIATLETSKINIDIESEYSGYILRKVNEGIEIQPGAVLAEFYDDLKSLESSFIQIPCNIQSDANIEKTSMAYYSKRAENIIKTHNINTKIFDGLVSSKTILNKTRKNRSAIDESYQREIDRTMFPDIEIENISATKQSEISTLIQADANLYSSSLTVQLYSDCYREVIKKIPGINEQLFPYIMLAYVKTLKHHPKFLSYYDQGKIIYYNRINLGILIDFGKGAKVIVIKDADQYSLVNLHENIINQICKYYDNTLTLSDVKGATTTVSDLSGQNILSFKPLLNKLQSTILGIGGDSTIPQKPMTFTVVFDHRVLSGVEVANFLNEFRECLVLTAKGSFI